jgi:hypothetical protein
MNESINKANIADKILITLSNKDKLIQLLKVYEISDIDKITDIQRYEREDDRKGLILKVKETNNRDTIKVLVDIKPGQPNINQIFDAVYETGADCDKRLIMYTGGKSDGDEENPTADQYVVESLVNTFNQYPLDLYLVKKSESIISKKFMDFIVIAEPYVTPKFLMKYLPSKLQFREVEFWEVHFYSLFDGYYRPWEAFTDEFLDENNCGFWMPINNLKIAVQWTKEEGACFAVTQQTGDDNDALEEFWLEKEKDLRSLFEGNEIDLRKDPGKPSRIIIKYWEFPPTVLLNATLEEKKDYAESLYHKLITLIGVIQSA